MPCRSGCARANTHCWSAWSACSHSTGCTPMARSSRLMASRCTHPCNWMAMTCSDVEHRSAIRRWLLASLLLVAPMAIAAESGQDETSTSAASTAVADVDDSGQDETVASAPPTEGKGMGERRGGNEVVQARMY